MDCLKIAVKEMKIPLETAVRAATLNPAIAAGIQDKFGSITPGKKANAVFLDKDLNVVMVLLNGKLIRNEWD